MKIFNFYITGIDHVSEICGDDFTGRKTVEKQEKREFIIPQSSEEKALEDFKKIYPNIRNRYITIKKLGKVIDIPGGDEVVGITLPTFKTRGRPRKKIL